MAAFSKWGRIAVAAGSVALLSFEAVHLESLKVASPVDNARQEAEEVKRTVEEKKVEQRQQEAKTAARRSRAPKMAPQFDGLNFYETFIGSSQR